MAFIHAWRVVDWGYGASILALGRVITVRSDVVQLVTIPNVKLLTAVHVVVVASSLGDMNHNVAFKLDYVTHRYQSLLSKIHNNLS